MLVRFFEITMWKRGLSAAARPGHFGIEFISGSATTWAASIWNVMPWKATLLPDVPVVEVVYVGEVTATELGQAMQETVRLAYESGRRLVLSNCREAQGGHSVGELYFLAEQLQQRTLTQPLRRALVRPADRAAGELVKFFEVSGKNRGLELAVFDDRAAALEWLLNLPAPPQVK